MQLKDTVGKTVKAVFGGPESYGEGIAIHFECGGVFIIQPGNEYMVISEPDELSEREKVALGLMDKGEWEAKQAKWRETQRETERAERHRLYKSLHKEFGNEPDPPDPSGMTPAELEAFNKVRTA